MSAAKAETKRAWWRCHWCSAGGSVQYEEGDTEAATAFNIRKAVERGHERSAICHVFRHLLQVDVSLTGAIAKQ